MSIKVDMKETGRQMLNLRKNKGMSVRQIAEALEVSVQTVYHWQNGLSLPSLDNLVTLSELYDMSIDELIVRKKAGE